MRSRVGFRAGGH